MRHLDTMTLRGVFFVFVLGVRSVLPFDGPADGGARSLLVRPSVASAVNSLPCASDRHDLKTRLERVLSTQRPNGDIPFEGPDSLFYHHPLLATLSLEVFRATGDQAFLQKTHGALKGYFNYLLVYHDADRDFLIERSSAPGAGYPSDLEDVGFNAMLALDMLSLSRICLELKMPVDALFWYRGMRTVSRQLVKASYDPLTSLFLPTRATASERVNAFCGLSALPIYFSSECGPEIALRVIRTHVLTDKALWPDSPASYLSSSSAVSDRTSDQSTRLLRTQLLLGALEWNGLAEEAPQRAADVRAGLDEEPAAQRASTRGDEIGRYAECVLRSDGPYAPFPRRQDIAVLDQLVFQKALLEPERTAALRKGVAEIDAYFSSRSSHKNPDRIETTAPDHESIGQSIREVYFSISLLRDKWKQRVLFSDNDRSEIPGFDVYAAVSDLWDDVVETLRQAETLVTRDQWLAEGFDLGATLGKTSVGPGDPAPVLFALSTTMREARIRTIVVHRPLGVDTLWSSPTPLVVSPGGLGREFSYAYPLARGRDSSIVPVVCSAEVRFDDGRRARYHFRMGVFVTRPVTCAVAFPKGTTLNDGTVPIEIVVNKHVSAGASVQAQWYSPIGLKPVEGRSVEAWIPEHTSEATMTLNIQVPNPCRPGSFPFTLSVFSNGEEIGTVSSALFRHYQWLFVGPFPGKRDAADTRYPPEVRTDPLDTYRGALGQLTWQPLPAAAYTDTGRISLGALLPKGSVGFLYTVIETAAPRVSAFYFESDAPAVLFVNGDPVARTGGEGGGSSHRADALLRKGANNVLVKTVSTGAPVVFFQLGDEEDLMSDEFNNNLWELIDGYQELVTRYRAPHAEEEHVQRQVTITYRDPKASSVSVVGSFNGWSPDNSAMRKNRYGEWEISLYLSPGRYTYRLLVDGATEVFDPLSPYTEPDGYGGQNSVLYVQ